MSILVCLIVRASGVAGGPSAIATAASVTLHQVRILPVVLPVANARGS